MGIFGRIRTLCGLAFASFLFLACAIRFAVAQGDVSLPFYDFIVVGGGAAGTVMAASLAERNPGKSILLVERGGLRDECASTLYRDTAPEAIMDDVCSESITTRQGVKSNIGRVLGGGTSINAGLYLEESEEYYRLLEIWYKVSLDRDLLKDASEWIKASNILSKSPHKFWTDYRNRVDPAFGGYTPRDEEHSYTAKEGSFYTYSIFNASDNVRHATDELVIDRATRKSKYPNLDVLLHAQAHHIEFERRDVMPNLRAAATGNANPQGGESETSRLRQSASMFGQFPNGDPAIQILSDTVNLGGGTGRMPSVISTAMDGSFAQFVGGSGILQGQQRGPREIPQPFSTRSAAEPRATCVVYEAAPVGNCNGMLCRVGNSLRRRKFERVCVKWDGRIILSAGAIHSPALLMKSGIGPVGELNKLRVRPVRVNPDVGRHLHDHAFFGFATISRDEEKPTGVTVQGSYSIEQVTPDGSANTCTRPEDTDRTSSSYDCPFVVAEELSGGRFLELFTIHFLRKTSAALLDPLPGLLADSMKACGDSNRVPCTDSLSNTIPVSTIRCLRRALISATFLTTPRSRGSVTFDSNHKVVVDPDYFGDKRDMVDMKYATRKLLNVVHQEGVASTLEPQGDSCLDLINTFVRSNPQFHYRLQHFPDTGDSNNRSTDADSAPLPFEPEEDPEPSDHANPPPAVFPPPPRSWASDNPRDDRLYERYIESQFGSIWHFAGSASIHKVVDERFSVIGISGLSVCDASVLPQVPRINPMAEIMKLGHYCAAVLSA